MEKNRPVVRMQEKVRERNHTQVKLILVNTDTDANIHNVIKITGEACEGGVKGLWWQWLGSSVICHVISCSMSSHIS